MNGISGFTPSKPDMTIIKKLMLYAPNFLILTTKMVSNTPEDYKAEFAQWLQKPRTDITNAHITKTYTAMFVLFNIADNQDDCLTKMQLICAIMLFTQRVPRQWFYNHIKTMFIIINQCDYLMNSIYARELKSESTPYERVWENRCKDVLPATKRRLENIAASIQ